MTSLVMIPAIVVGLLAVSPTVVVAQTAASTPRVSVGAGVGLAFPFHGDFDFTAGAWDADVRLALSRHTVFEAAVGEWRHTETSVRENVTVQAVSGPPGTVGRVEQSTRRVQRAIQVNLLGTGVLGRVRVVGGGGVGLLQHDRRFRQSIEDCSAGVADVCGSTESTFSNIAGSAQAVGGVDIRVAGSSSVYGQARFIVSMRDPAGSDLRVTTGARWSF
jgi:hypothetical protein